MVRHVASGIELISPRTCAATERTPHRFAVSYHLGKATEGVSTMRVKSLRTHPSRLRGLVRLATVSVMLGVYGVATPVRAETVLASPAATPTNELTNWNRI